MTRQLHIFVSENLFSRLNLEAEQRELDRSEWCRRKLDDDPQLNRIEQVINKIARELDKMKENIDSIFNVVYDKRKKKLKKKS